VEPSTTTITSKGLASSCRERAATDCRTTSRRWKVGMTMLVLGGAFIAQSLEIAAANVT
jgi:hypothetical protein